MFSFFCLWYLCLWIQMLVDSPQQWSVFYCYLHFHGQCTEYCLVIKRWKSHIEMTVMCKMASESWKVWALIYSPLKSTFDDLCYLTEYRQHNCLIFINKSWTEGLKFWQSLFHSMLYVTQNAYIPYLSCQRSCSLNGEKRKKRKNCLFSGNGTPHKLRLRYSYWTLYKLLLRFLTKLKESSPSIIWICKMSYISSKSRNTAQVIIIFFLFYHTPKQYLFFFSWCFDKIWRL